MRQTRRGWALHWSGNRALVEIKLRNGELSSKIAQMERDYLKTHRFLDSDFDQKLSDETAKRPLYSEKELAHPDLLGVPTAPATLQSKADYSNWGRSLGLNPGEAFRTSTGALRGRCAVTFQDPAHGNRSTFMVRLRGGSAAFNPDTDLPEYEPPQKAERFDPDKDLPEYEETPPKPRPESGGAPEAFGKAAMEGASFGFTPALAGLREAAGPEVNELADKYLPLPIALGVKHAAGAARLLIDAIGAHEDPDAAGRPSPAAVTPPGRSGPAQ